MTRKLSVGALAAALLLSGALVGVSYGGNDERSAAMRQPTVLEFKWNTRAEGSEVRFFRLRQYDRKCCGQVTEKDMPLMDLDGNVVGRQHISCTASDWTTWFCRTSPRSRMVRTPTRGP